MKTSLVPVEVKDLRETKFSHRFENDKKFPLKNYTIFIDVNIVSRYKYSLKRYNYDTVVSIVFSPICTVELTTNWYQLHNGVIYKLCLRFTVMIL